jgi:hypothetical protein
MLNLNLFYFPFGVCNVPDIVLQNVGLTVPGHRFLILFLFFSLSIMIFEAPVLAKGNEFAMDESVRKALETAKQGRSESAVRMGQVFLVVRLVCCPAVLLPWL